MYSAPIPENDEDRLATLYRYSVLDTPPERGYEDVTALASHICGTPFATITLVDRDRQWFKSEIGFGTNETGRADGFCACALLSPEPLIIEDTLLDPRFQSNPFVTGGPEIRFYAGAPLIAPNGQILGTVCVFDTKPRTLTEAQVHALEALSRQVIALMEARLTLVEREKSAAALMQSEKLAAVGRLASSMAHSINNPLEAVTNLIYLAHAQAQDPEIKEWLKQADQELRRVSIIANQTLRFHKQASKPRVVSCLDLFTATLDLYEARLINSGVSVEKRKRAIAPVECFEGDIRHVIGSIIANSIDAMPSGGRLLVRSRAQTNWLTGEPGIVLTIADTGSGIDPETSKRIFEAFFSTKGIGGAGLGLWVSANIVQRHSGRLTIRSSQRNGHHGTVAAIFLPYRISEIPSAIC